MNRNRIVSLLAAFGLLAGCLTGCGGAAAQSGSTVSRPLTEMKAPDFAASADPEQLYDLNALSASTAQAAPRLTGAVNVVLTDGSITVDGEPVSTDPTAEVYTAHDIVYYEAGHDFTYGEGTAADVHTRDEADAHTVVHITQPGMYRLSGRLTAGQIAVDLGENAKDDPNAVVTLVLDGVDITCTVAPAIIFYNVYECGSADAAAATRDVDTTTAGARMVIADDSENTVNGSYVARIYKPGTVVLNEDGTEVEDAKKLHKYDAAFYSRMSMNLYGGAQNSGTLTINAENEGLDSELHLTIYGGRIRITSGNDGINTNEDEVSVTTIHGGLVNITVTGSTGEGDGIDSNGWLVINGGMVLASACGFSGDAGIDSDMGIWINGGVVAASGNMLDHIAGGTAPYAVFQFAGSRSGGQTYRLAAVDGSTVAGAVPANDCSILILSTPQMTDGEYTLWCGQTRLAHSTSDGFGALGGFGGQRPQGSYDREFPDDFDPDDFEFEWDEDWDEQRRGDRQPMANPGSAPQPPQGFDPAQGSTPPDGVQPGRGGRGETERPGNGALTDVFTVNGTQNLFSGVKEAA